MKLLSLADCGSLFPSALTVYCWPGLDNDTTFNKQRTVDTVHKCRDLGKQVLIHDIENTSIPMSTVLQVIDATLNENPSQLVGIYGRGAPATGHCNYDNNDYVMQNDAQIESYRTICRLVTHNCLCGYWGKNNDGHPTPTTDWSHWCSDRDNALLNNYALSSKPSLYFVTPTYVNVADLLPNSRWEQILNHVNAMNATACLWGYDLPWTPPVPSHGPWVDSVARLSGIQPKH